MKKAISFILCFLLFILVFCPLLEAEAATQLSISISTSENGTVNPIGNFTVSYGNSFRLELFPDEGYIAESINIKKKVTNSNGEIQTVTTIYDQEHFGKPLSSAYNLTMNSDCKIFVNFVKEDAKMKGVTIIHSNDGYADSVSKSYNALEGAHLRDVICTPKSGYMVSAVFLNNDIMYSSNNSKTNNLLDWNENKTAFSFKEGNNIITDDTEIRILYKPIGEEQYLFTYSIGKNGRCSFESNAQLPTLSPTGTTTLAIPSDVSMSLSVQADANYVIESFTVNGADVPNAIGKESASYSFDDIDKDIVIKVTFMCSEIIVSLGCSGNGRLSHSESSYEFNKGDSFTVDFIPDKGYAIEAVIIDGYENNNAKVTGSYTFENLEESHSIFVSFTTEKAVSYTVAVSYGNNGYVEPNGKLSVSSGGYISFSLNPEPGYELKSIRINNSDVDTPIGDTFFLKNIKQNVLFYVDFAKIKSDVNTDSEPSVNHDVGLFGDANKNGKIEMNDVVLLQKSIAHLVEFDDELKKISDVDANGSVEMGDVVYIQKYIAQLITSFPADKANSNSGSGEIVDAGSDTPSPDSDTLLQMQDYKARLKYHINIIRVQWASYYSGTTSKFDEASYAQFLSAYSNALFVYNDYMSTLPELKKAYDSLAYALENLIADMSATPLEELVATLLDDIEKYYIKVEDSVKYTDNTWAEYYTALVEAQRIADSPYSYTKSEIWEADTALFRAHTRLQYNLLNCTKSEASQLLYELLAKYEVVFSLESIYTEASFKRFSDHFYACVEALEHFSLYSLDDLAYLYETMIELYNGLIYA